jgi:hypothetical protein
VLARYANVTTPLLGLDYAGGRPGGAAIAAAGYGFVCRYLTDGGSGLPGKLLTTAEYADLQAHGIAIVLNWETTAGRMLEGYSAGNTDAGIADQVARALGHPADRPVYFSCDFDAAPSDQAAIDSYLMGVAAVLGSDRTGVYGSYYVVQRCLDNGAARWTWQTTAWSGGQREPRAHLYQRTGTVTVGGVACDVNEALQADFGQYLLTQLPPIIRPGHHRERHEMDQLPPTNPPADPNSDPKTWPQRNYDVGFDLAGGWEGDFAGEFGVQEWGGRTNDGARGYLALASRITPRGLVPVAPVFTAAVGGAVIWDHQPTVSFVAPRGATGLTLNYAAPGGAYVAEGRSA